MIRYETERLIFRDYEESDFDAVFAFMGDEETSAYMYIGTQSEEQVRSYISRMIERAKRIDQPSTYYAVVLKETCELIGNCEIDLTKCEAGALAWMLNKRHHGRGYATEMGRKLMQIGFEDLKLHRLFAHCDAENLASRHVMEKLGMRCEALHLEARPANRHVTDGRKYSDEMLYAILRREWLENNR